jgi:hypothetical protein
MPVARKSKNRKRTPRVGDRVWLRMGTRRVSAEVIEDRGPIGVAGRRLLRIRQAGSGDDPPRVYEVPAEETVLASAK